MYSFQSYTTSNVFDGVQVISVRELFNEIYMENNFRFYVITITTASWDAYDVMWSQLHTAHSMET